MKFSMTLHKLLISAALLPSLLAEYNMINVTSKGETGSKTKFVIDVPTHVLSFNTKLGKNKHKTRAKQDDQSVGSDKDDIEEEDNFGDGSLPSEASIELPLVHITAEYIVQEIGDPSERTVNLDGSILSEGSYLNAKAEIGELAHTLTTDLLNHLVFVQKVFMKEVNEVVQKMSGSDRPVPVWSEFGDEVVEVSQPSQRPLLFSIAVILRDITITATTPANSFVRFETENISFTFFLMLAVAFFVQLLLTSTKWGTAIYATGSNRQAAEVSGINTFKVKLICFMATSFLSGCAGLLTMSQLPGTPGDPIIGLNLELDILAGVIVGGVSLYLSLIHI